MSFRSTNSATAHLKQEADSIISTLLDAQNLPSWNPAFSRVDPPDPDGLHKVTVHKILKGALTYRRPNSHTIEIHIAIPGLTEVSTFALDSKPHGTQVTHTITQQGSLAAIIGNQEASLVPSKRLARLAHALKN